MGAVADQPAAGLRLCAACSLAIDRCRAEYPPLQEFAAKHLAACWRAAETVANAMTDQRPLLEVTDLVKHYAGSAAACCDVASAPCMPSMASAFPSAKGETLGLGRRIRLRQIDGRA